MKVQENRAVASPETFALSCPPILYISFDGMLEPLGRSQVLTYLYRLADSGFRFTLFSLEHERDISAASVSRVTRELLQHRIEWRWDLYRQGGVSDVLRNLWTSYRSARALCKNRDVGLIHARSLLPALIARMINISKSIPYLFDLRGCWVEERVAEGLWIKNKVTYNAAKRIERSLINHAQALVTLTELHANDLGNLARRPEQSLTVIPTCADYELFAEPADLNLLSSEIVSRLSNKLVIAMVGSINKSYSVQESFQLFQEILKLRPDAHLLCLTRQPADMQDLLRRHGVPENNFTVQSVPHEEMPSWMALIDWGVLLLNEAAAKRGSMPTKLAEYLAAGVRIVQYGCNSEVSQKVIESGCGILLRNLSLEELKRAAQQIASDPFSEQDVSAARIKTRSYFGIEHGVIKYAQIYSNVGQRRG